ncbi:MAG: phosphate ABC transporter permease PstA [Proteobacteria bacterium]|nr:phosphate ABC transporter permease PstA [Pseudomonadota bacterium]
MSDVSDFSEPSDAHSFRNTEAADRRLRKRHAAERRFRFYGAAAVSIALLALAALIFDIVGKGHGAFQRHVLTLQIYFDPDVIDPRGDRSSQSLRMGNYTSLVRNSLTEIFSGATGRSDRRSLGSLVSTGAAFQLQDMVMADPSLVGERRLVTVPFADDADMYYKGYIRADTPEVDRRLLDTQIAWLDQLERRGHTHSEFNANFFTSGDSREPELAGILGALTGSILTLCVTLLLSFPLGVASAIYLEEFAPKNRWTDLIEVNINNLAAVPSIVFGLLGLGMFLNVFGFPRSAPLIGGMVLALMTLPTIIIAGRAALKAVPPSIREAAMSMGASPLQVVLQHVLPLAMPGILTGTIIGMAQALGETAPLLMIGMVAFIVDIPSAFTSPATVLPVQIFLWSDSPERAFVEKTSAAIMVLLLFLMAMNLAAVLLRQRFERRW